MAGLVQLVDIFYGRYSGFGNDIRRTIGVECIDFHTEPFGDTGYVTTNLSERMNTQLFAFEFGS